MANTNLILKNPRTGTIKATPTNFSWMVLFFGFAVPLYRKDWKWAIIILFSQVVTLGLASIPFAFLYNKIYVKKLIKLGYNYFSRTGYIAPKTLQKYLQLQNHTFNKAFSAAE